MKKTFIFSFLFTLVHLLAFNILPSCLLAYENSQSNILSQNKYDSSKIVAALTPRPKKQSRPETQPQQTSYVQSAQPPSTFYTDTLQTVVDLSMRVNQAESKAETALNELKHLRRLEQEHIEVLQSLNILQKEVDRLQGIEKEYAAARQTIDEFENNSLQFQSLATTQQSPSRTHMLSEETEEEYFQIIHLLNARLDEVETSRDTLFTQLKIVEEILDYVQKENSRLAFQMNLQNTTEFEKNYASFIQEKSSPPDEFKLSESIQ